MILQHRQAMLLAATAYAEGISRSVGGGGQQHLVSVQVVLDLMASPAALYPDGCSLGLKELHSALPASEASLHLDC